MAIWRNVSKLSDGQGVNEETFNRPINELVDRTEWLRERLGRLGDGLSAVTVTVTLSREHTPSVGDVVCADPTTGEFGRAIASMDLYDAYTASEKVFAIGLLISKSGEGFTGSVILYGKSDLQGLNLADMVEDPSFVAGHYYLSSTIAGKLTRFPKGPRVLVGFFAPNPMDGDTAMQAFINPQHMDIEAHAHRTYILNARPAGSALVENGEARIYGYLPDGMEEDDSSDASQGVPRLSVCGDWTSWLDFDYEITIEKTEYWPCPVSWKQVGGTEEGNGEFRCFGDTVAVGSLGMRVRLEPGPGMGEDSPFASDVEECVWALGRQDGRGWVAAGASSLFPLESGGTLRVSGVSDRTSNSITMVKAPFAYNLTLGISSIADGDKLHLADGYYTFKDVPDESDPYQVPILDQGQDTFDTLAQLATRVPPSREHAVVFDEDKRQVLYGNAGVDPEFNDAPISHLTYDASRMLVFYTGEGESLASASETDSCIHLEEYSPVTLANGLSVMLVGSAPDSVDFDILSVPGAAYRYNIEFDNDFKLHFPPVPAKSGCFMLNGVEMESVSNYGGKAVIDIGDDSIYWRDATEGRQPWPIPAMTNDTPVPVEDEYREMFHMVSEFHSETGPVTSLRPAKNSPVTLKRVSTDEDATVGDLEIDVDLMLGMEDAGIPGYKVPKASRGNKMLLGPVVERLVAGPGISFSRTEGMPEGQGVFTISADGAMYSGDFETIALENAKLDSIGMFPYVRLLGWTPNSDSNIPTGFVAKFHVPATAAPASYRVRFYATVFGEEGFEGDYRSAGIQLDYSALPDFTSTNSGVIPTANLRTGLIRPNQDDESVASRVLNIPLGSVVTGGGVKYDAYDPILVHNDPRIGTLAGKSIQVLDYAFPNQDDCSDYLQTHPEMASGVFGLHPGYTVAIRLSRTAPSSGTPYTGPIGILNFRWAIEAVDGSVQPQQLSASSIDDIVTTTVMNLRKVPLGGYGVNTGYQLADILARVMNALK